MKVKVKKVSHLKFAPYGKIARLSVGKPTSQSAEYKFWSDLADYSISGDTEIGICTVYRRSVARIQSLERHMNTPEILIPIDGPFVLPLMKDGLDKIEVFQFQVGEAAVIDRGIWHGACLPVKKKEASYFVIFLKGTPASDVQKKLIHPADIV